LEDLIRSEAKSEAIDIEQKAKKDHNSMYSRYKKEGM